MSILFSKLHEDFGSNVDENDDEEAWERELDEDIPLDIHDRRLADLKRA